MIELSIIYLKGSQIEKGSKLCFDISEDVYTLTNGADVPL